MQTGPTAQLYPYRRNADQDQGQSIGDNQAPSRTARKPVIIVGAGPVGLSLAIDLALKDIPVVVLDEAQGIGIGSRAICFAKRTLEIFDRLGCGSAMNDKGVQWNKGKVFRDQRQIFEFNLAPEDGFKHPAFINLQQYYVEQNLVERARALQAKGSRLDIRGGNKVQAIQTEHDHVCVEIDTIDGPYQLEAQWLIACDGPRSTIRQLMQLDFRGRVFEDNFLIADVIMKADFPTERWFWFDPPFNPGQSALLHKQPDDVWRIDFQLGWDIDREEVVRPQNVVPRIKAMLGPDIDFELEWVSVYTFQCCTMERYRHDRVIFAGDSAHQVSPFGARGANGGFQDADNLAWKLALVLAGDAPGTLLDSYHIERHFAARENILNSTRATDFITPKSPISRMYRDAVLDLVEHAPFARPLINSGRLSVPAIYDQSPLNTPDQDNTLPAGTRPGAPYRDLPLLNTMPGAASGGAPSAKRWLGELLNGKFQLLMIDIPPPDADIARQQLRNIELINLSSSDSPFLQDRYLSKAEQALYLIRPDQHIAARWTRFDLAAIQTAAARARGQAPETYP